MYFLITFFTIFVNFSLFSCTPPERTSDLFALTTSTHSSSRNSRVYNALFDVDIAQEKIIIEISPRKLKKLLQEQTEKEIKEKIAAEHELKKAIEQEKTALYYEWPRSARIRFNTIAFVYSISCNDSVHP